MAKATIREMLVEAGMAPPGGLHGQHLLEEARGILEGARQNPEVLATEVVRLRQQCQRHERDCAHAAEAATNLEKMIESMMNGNATGFRLESIREAPDGFRAVCRQGDQIREFSVHPDVDREQLRQLHPWEYVRVHENVVVGTWKDDPSLFEQGLGEVVTFQGYAGRKTLVRISRLGQAEEVVRLAPTLLEQPIPPDSKLILLRDNPRWAIACLPGKKTTGRFEVSVDTIDTKLSDLAGMEPIAEKLLLEIVKRIISPEIRREFNLDPLRGLLLCSNKPGMGKTAFMRAFARQLADLGQQWGFDVALYLVQPNEFKCMWHGEDSRLVREEFFAVIRARREMPRTRPLVQLAVLDEIDSLGRRPEARDPVVSSAHSDALEAFLVEMDGMVQLRETDPPAHLLVVGMTNRPERIDDALKRPGRLGDEVIDIPDLDQGGAEQVCLVYARSPEIPWVVDGEIVRGLPPEEIARQFLRPALMAVFNTALLQYSSDTQKKFAVTAGQMMAAVHYRKAMTVAKNRAADRRLRGLGVPGVAYEDVVEGLFDTALTLAAQMQVDPHMLVRHLKIKVPVARIDLTPRDELEQHRFSHL